MVNMGKTFALIFLSILLISSVSAFQFDNVKNPSKAVIVRGKRGVKSGVKKAYVYLKKGDNINLS